MTYVETPVSGWEAAAGRSPGTPAGPAGSELWDAVLDRINPDLARPVLRPGVEGAELISVRGAAYLMLRSPDDGRRACYLRLTPEQWQLAMLMDGTNTVARLVAEFARIAGRLAPDEVRRVVADLAGNRMLEDLPAGAFSPPAGNAERPFGARLGSALLAVARGRRYPLVAIDGLVSGLYRAGGRWLFTRVAAAGLAIVALLGFGLFALTWWRGGESVFLTGGSYLAGALVLLVLNGVALACHEFGHALGVKHAGRAVPVAGWRMHYGIPSVFVDASDVWMAGRRARMIATAAGPVTGLVLAGTAQLAGLVVPALASVAFKLAFLWYAQTLFYLNPFLPLDGYRLLVDWLEIPHLRSRALSWLGGWFRRRQPRYSALDREGRLIARYGILAVLWLVIAVSLAYRVWVDRVAGLVTGLWPDGSAARLLLAAITLGLLAPVGYLAVGRLGTTVRRYRTRLAEARREADVPRRLAALRASELRGLPAPALASLAARAEWLHPPAGRQLVVAGGAQASVFVVVAGALHARRPGDAGGTVRHQVGPGGVVGLANALTGRSTVLDWYAADTTLLVLPTAAVATVIGPLPGPPAADRHEAETLFTDTPALAGLADDERLALIAAAHPVDLEPGAPVVLSSPTHAVVVESGVIALADGVELRRGTLVGPVGDGVPGMVAQARTPVRLWVLPDAASLPPLVGSARQAAEVRAAGPLPASPLPTSLRAGRAGQALGGYPPLAVPPGPPDDADPELDRRFERRMRWLVGLAFLVAVLVAGSNVAAGPAWAEMPTDRVLLVVDRGTVSTVVAGQRERLAAGAQAYLPVGARVEVGAGATGRLTFRGGGYAVLCPGVRGTVDQLGTAAGDPVVPSGTLTLTGGRIVADTASTSGAFAPLALVLRRPVGDVRSAGSASFAADPATVTVATGQVRAAGAVVASTVATIGCGTDAPATVPAPEPTGSPTEESTGLPPAPVPSSAPASPSTTPSPTPTTTTAAPTRTPTEAPTTVRPPTRPTTHPTPRPTITRPAPKPTAPKPTTPPTTPPTTQPAPDPTTTEPKPPANASVSVPVTIAPTDTDIGVLPAPSDSMFLPTRTRRQIV